MNFFLDISVTNESETKDLRFEVLIECITKLVGILLEKVPQFLFDYCINGSPPLWKILSSQIFYGSSPIALVKFSLSNFQNGWTLIFLSFFFFLKIKKKESLPPLITILSFIELPTIVIQEILFYPF